MNKFIIFDVETWTDVGAKKREWRGMTDFPPLLMQVGAAKLEVNPDGLKILEWMDRFVWPSDEFGNKVTVTSFFTELTGISEETIVNDGVSVKEALAEFAKFCGSCNVFSYGNDMQNRVIMSCYAAGIPVPIPANKSFDIKRIFHRAGQSEEFLLANNSGNLCKALGIPVDIKEHNAQQDVLSQIEFARHLHANSMLDLEWFLEPGNVRAHLTQHPGPEAQPSYSCGGFWGLFKKG